MADLTRADPRKLAFGQCFNRLLVALRGGEPDQARMQVYFEALGSLPLWALEQAATELATRLTWFPTTGEWYQAAQRHVVALEREQSATPRTEPWHDECALCRDTGWKPLKCTPAMRCGRARCAETPPDDQGRPFTHRYVEVCICRSSNRTWARHHPSKQAPEPVGGGRRR